HPSPYFPDQYRTQQRHWLPPRREWPSDSQYRRCSVRRAPLGNRRTADSRGREPAAPPCPPLPYPPDENRKPPAHLPARQWLRPRPSATLSPPCDPGTASARPGDKASVRDNPPVRSSLESGAVPRARRRHTTPPAKSSDALNRPPIFPPHSWHLRPLTGLASRRGTRRARGAGCCGQDPAAREAGKPSRTVA